MKKRIVALLLGLMLLTSACAGQPQVGGESAPPVESAPAIPEFSETTGVYADWSKLKDFGPIAEVGTRLSEGAITELTPSNDYGMLIPYVGEIISFDMTYYTQRSYKMGLVTKDGCVVLDPVLKSAYPISDNAGGYALVLQSSLDGMLDMYALCASDGSWCTDFIYEWIYGNSEGEFVLISRIDGEFSLEKSCIMDRDGNVVKSFGDFSPEIEFNDPSDLNSAIYQIVTGTDGYALAYTAEETFAFIDAEGKLLKSDEIDGYFSNAMQFYGGVAAVSPLGSWHWGVINTEGEWVVEPKYDFIETIYGTTNLYVRTIEGERLVVDTKGRVVLDLSALTDPTVDGVNDGYLITEWIAEEPRIYDAEMNLITDNYSSMNYLESGVIIGRDSETSLFYDGETVREIDSKYDVYGVTGEYFVAIDKISGDGVLMDLDGNILISMPNCEAGVEFCVDEATGAPYLCRNSNSSRILMRLDGKSARDSYFYVYDGFVCRIDESGCEIVNFEGERIFRTSIDLSD